MRRWLELRWRLFWARDAAAKTRVRRSVSQKHAKRKPKRKKLPAGLDDFSEPLV